MSAWRDRALHCICYCICIWRCSSSDASAASSLLCTLATLPCPLPSRFLLLCFAAPSAANGGGPTEVHHRVIAGCCALLIALSPRPPPCHPLHHLASTLSFASAFASHYPTTPMSISLMSLPLLATTAAGHSSPAPRCLRLFCRLPIDVFSLVAQRLSLPDKLLHLTHVCRTFPPLTSLSFTCDTLACTATLIARLSASSPPPLLSLL